VLVVKIVAAPPPPPDEGSATIGAAGGFVNGPEGVRLAIPPAALESDITFRIARESSGAPPLPAGIDLASAVYAITPHGQPFAVSASVELPVSATLAAGRPSFLMKAEPGGRWSVIASGNGTNASLRAGIDSLSYLAVGVCQNNLPAGSPFAQACPSSHQLGLELLLNGSTPVPISQDTTYGAPIPVVLVTAPETLTFRMTWTRPAGTSRVDTLDTGTGLLGSTVVRQAGFTFATASPHSLQVNENSFSRTFTVDVDPTRVSGATGPNGVVRRIWAQAAFGVTGPGNVGSADWEFNAWVPIQVRSLATLPVIDSQPANVGVTAGQSASFTVAASVSPAATLNYQWAHRTGASGSFAPIAGATGPSYTTPATQLADSGAQFQVEVCATRCVTSNVATLTVTQAPVAPSFIVQPSDIGVLTGQTASFSVTAGGNPLPRIEWQSAPAGDPGNFTAVAGAIACTRTDPPASGTGTAATCTVGPLGLGDSGRRYRAAAINSASTTFSAVATVTVSAAPVAPSITQQPQPQTTTAFGGATFSVTATGTATLNYAWKLNGGNLPSQGGQFSQSATCSGYATYSDGGATLTLSNLTAGCNGVLVSVEVSNTVLPAALSNAVTLTVTAGAVRPSLLVLPTAEAADIGQTATFSVQASGANLTYQWSSARAGNFNPDTGEVDSYPLLADIPGATASSYTTPPTTIGDDQRMFAVLVCSGAAQPPTYPNCVIYGALNTDGVRLTINPVVSRNFSMVASGTSANLNALAFSTPSIGVAVGDGGTIVRTTDGGQTWAPVASGTVATLRAVAFSGAGRGVVTGENGLLFTNDDGATWTATLPGGSGVCCLGVGFADTSTAVATYRDGFLRSTDSGQSFAAAFSTTWIGPAVVRFGSATNGAVADGRILYTTDGGVSWSVAIQPPTVGASTLAFANSSIAVASAGSGFLRTTNGGQAWTLLYGSSFPRYVHALAFNSAGVGLALGEGPSFSALRTPDFGQTWIPLALPGLAGRMNSVAFADANAVIAVGSGGTILRFTAAGL
jgi:photosystem II stability/assembly factor-like uncharacterized protein